MARPTKRKRNRKKNIIWFNPPYSRNVSTNIEKKFLHLVDKHFPRSNKLHKIFNRNTVKVSYSCTDNMAKIIKNHNKKATSKVAPTSPQCNCREKDTCPLNGNCQATSVIYQAKVKKATNPEKTYIGLTEGTKKQRSYTHKLSFNNRKYINSTTLSKHIWKLKDNNQAPGQSKQAPLHTPTSQRDACYACKKKWPSLLSLMKITY